jgi:hypothetical protein
MLLGQKKMGRKTYGYLLRMKRCKEDGLAARTARGGIPQDDANSVGSGRWRIDEERP